jgi:hypothetical protein
MEGTVLYASRDVHRAIKGILGYPVAGEDRVALVAFVGNGAEA